MFYQNKKVGFSSLTPYINKSNNIVRRKKASCFDTSFQGLILLLSIITIYLYGIKFIIALLEFFKTNPRTGRFRFLNCHLLRAQCYLSFLAMTSSYILFKLQPLCFMLFLVDLFNT